MQGPPDAGPKAENEQLVGFRVSGLGMKVLYLAPTRFKSLVAFLYSFVIYIYVKMKGMYASAFSRKGQQPTRMAL